MTETRQFSPIDQSIELFEQQHFYDGLSSWFAIDQEQREGIILQTVEAVLESGIKELSFITGPEEMGDISYQQRWVLRNFGMLTSPCAAKIFDEANTETITPEDSDELTDAWNRPAQERLSDIVNAVREPRIQHLVREGQTKVEASKTVPRLNWDFGDGNPSASDFPTPADFIQLHFSSDEIRRFVIRCQQLGVPEGHDILPEVP